MTDVAYNDQDRAFLVQCREEMWTLGWSKCSMLLPFFGQVRLVAAGPASGIKTMAVDFLGNLYVNVEWAKGLEPIERAGVICHEILHLLLHHDIRRDGREPKKWNRAGDRAINQFLRVCDIKLPGDALYPAAGQTDWSAEQLFEVESDPPVCTVVMATAGCGIIDPVPGTPGTGTAPGEGPDDRPDGVTVLRDANGNVTIQVDGALADKLARRLSEAAAAARMIGAGSAAGNALARLTEAPPPRVDWKTILSNGFNDAAATADREDQTWQRRSRRSTEIITLPGWIQYAAKAVVVIDTSGSMPDEAVAEAVANTVAIAEATSTRLFLVVHDAEVHFADWIDGTYEQVGTKMVGRGGTLFAPAYEAIGQVMDHFDVLIHLTDGVPCDYWPQLPFNCKRGIVALLGHHVPVDAVPPDYLAIEAKL